MKKYFDLIRVKHYIKNFLIFFPLFFNKSFFNFDLFIRCFIGFVSFSLISSCVYIFNDVRDVNYDRKHYLKKFRPIASGEVSLKNALLLLIVLFVLSLLIQIIGCYMYDISFYSILVLIGYFFFNIFYTLYLKNICLIDVICLAVFYLIRIIYGGLITDILVSNWLFLTVLFASLYLGFAKRYAELDNGDNFRLVLKKYSKDFLSNNIYICLCMTLIFYCLWASETDYRFILYSVILIYYIVMKYNMNISKCDLDNPVDIVLNDKLLLIFIFVYFSFLGVVIYVL